MTGFNLSDENPDLVIRGEVRNFFIDEKRTYEGSVILKYQVLDSNGNAVWTGVSSGSATRWGRKFSPENYYEVLSDSFIDATTQLFHNRGFRDALKGQKSE